MPPLARRAARSTALSLSVWLSLCLAAGLVGASAARAQAEDPRPDIVVIYLDDVSPHDGRLWSEPERTPTLANLFVQTASTFSSAFGETPLCCPGRAATLTACTRPTTASTPTT